MHVNDAVDEDDEEESGKSRVKRIHPLSASELGDVTRWWSGIGQDLERWTPLHVDVICPFTYVVSGHRASVKKMTNHQCLWPALPKLKLIGKAREKLSGQNVEPVANESRSLDRGSEGLVGGH